MSKIKKNLFKDFYNNNKNNNNNNNKNGKDNKETDIKQKIKEKEKKIKLKNLLLKRQYYMRKEFEKRFKNCNNNEKINQFLEDMCIYGNVAEREIEENPDKYMKVEEVFNTKDGKLFCLGLLGKSLKNIGIKVFIEKNDNNKSEGIFGYEDYIKEEKKNEALTVFQFIASGYINKKKYILKFDFGEKETEELLNDIQKYNNFKKELIEKISNDYNTPTNKIIVTYPQKGSLDIQVIFQSEEFNNLDTEDFLNKFKNEGIYGQLNKLKTIYEDMIMSACILKKDAFDNQGNRFEGWGEGECRGRKEYYPPKGWIGYGLKVLNEYENDIWIGMENVEGEWCVAYHGIAGEKPSEEVKKVVGKIVKKGLKSGHNQMHSKCPDCLHKGKVVGDGAYCSALPEIARKFAGKCNIKGEIYYVAFMLRVNQSKIRQCNTCDDSEGNYYWVLNGTPDEIRPYRILYKLKKNE